MNFKLKGLGTALFLLCSFAAGFANGLLGTGGGIIIVFVLGYLTKKCASDGTDIDRRDMFASALAVMLPLSVVSLVVYFLRGVFREIDYSTLPAFIFPAIIGGYAGAWLLYKIKLPLLQKLFALIVVWSGFYMIIT